MLLSKVVLPSPIDLIWLFVDINVISFHIIINWLVRDNLAGLTISFKV
jgi:hypothetical protein